MTTTSLEDAVQAQIGGQYSLTGVLERSEGRIVFRATPAKNHSNLEDAAVIVDTSGEPSHFNKYLEASFLRHPNLIRVFHTGWLDAAPDRFPYLATESPSTTLATVLTQNGLSPTDSAELHGQLLAGLTKLHSENLAYGDLHECSIWRVGGQWKLADYSQLQVADSFRNRDGFFTTVTSSD